MRPLLARKRAVIAFWFATLISISSCSDNHSDNHSHDAAAHDAATTDSGAKASADAGPIGAADAGPDAALAGDNRERPAGPAADVSEEISGGNGPFIGAAAGLDTPDAYVDHEYVAAGIATAYQSPDALGNDGRWSFEPSTTADYRTRILVRRPADSAQASGTVIVEWLNVSGGADANPEYASLAEEIVRQHHTWVGVSAQLIGVEGGPVIVQVPGANDLAGKGLKAIDAARYASLQHPGDGYAFDIFTQVARAVRNGGALLGGAKPKIVLAAGESQSAFALTTYYDGVQPLTRVFDGFLLHSRGAASLALVAPGHYADLAGSLGDATHPILRDDLEAQVLELQSEGDLTGLLLSSVVRQPDSDHFRLWEVTGTAHADAHLVGDLANSADCGVPINHGPLHIVAKAAINALETWVRTGKQPASAARIELSNDATPVILRDGDGIALGGIRTPPVDVPVDALSGEPGPNPAVICLLLGSSKPLTAARLAELYPSAAAYTQQYQAATDRAIQSHFVLEAEREALLAFAQPARISP